MLEVKIPSPPIAKIKAHINANHLDMASAIRGYMATIFTSLKFVAKSDIGYQNGRIADDGIFASIEVSQLPNYPHVANMFGNIGFEQAMLSQIAIGNKHYGNDCPMADKNSLWQPIDQWSHRWVTIYLWTIVRADFSMRFMGSPRQLVSNNELMAELVSKLTCDATPEDQPIAEQEALLNNESAANPPEQTTNVAAEIKEVELPKVTSKPNHLSATDAAKIAIDCIGIEVFKDIIKKSNNRAVELHCMAQGMSLNDVLKEREVINQETIHSLASKIGDLLCVINSHPDFFEDANRFKAKPPVIVSQAPIDESDPL